MGKLTQSYVHGASDLPLIGDTIGVHLDRMAALSPDRPALIAPRQDVRWHYGEFRDRVDELAAGLLGLQAFGDTVGVQHPGARVGAWQHRWVWGPLAAARSRARC